MNKFNELIEKVKQAETGAVFFLGVQHQEDGKHYIDPRTGRNKNGLHVVKPICFLNGHYWYVCPNCDDIHASNAFGKIVTTCCDGDNQRVKVRNGILQATQYAPIILEE